MSFIRRRTGEVSTAKSPFPSLPNFISRPLPLFQSLLSRLQLYIYSARYYRSGQIRARLRLILQRCTLHRLPWLMAWRYSAPKNFARPARALFLLGGRCQLRHEKDLRLEMDVVARRYKVANLHRGVFMFLNTMRRLGRPVDWSANGTSRLWRYNLHYFDYALDLATAAVWAKDEQAAMSLKALILDWIEANPLGRGVGWHAYPLARRLVNWIQAASLVQGLEPFEDDDFRRTLTRSLYEQAYFLEDHLEFDSLGNHLLADGKALVFAGLFFQSRRSSRWLRLGQDILWGGLREQILADGGHYERTPMYHSLVLQDYLETILALRENGREVPRWVKERLIQMAEFLAGICHPDGEIPLFGDSAFGNTAEPSDVLAAASLLLGSPNRWPHARPGFYTAMLTGTTELPAASPFTAEPIRLSWVDSGYYVFAGADSEDRLILDAKPMGPDHIPAHGHCSLFSYELSMGGRRLIVDSGVEEYQSGPWRDFWRSTRAHNTVAVDGREQAETWGAFRVARRPRVLELSYGQENRFHVFLGSHDGFARYGDHIHHRRYLIGLQGAWVVLDHVTGRGEHAVQSFIHFHPEVICDLDGQQGICATLAPLKVRVITDVQPTRPPLTLRFACGDKEPIQGWYAPEFGRRRSNPVLILSRYGSLPVFIGYIIVPEEWKVVSWNWSLEESQLGTKTLSVAVHAGRGTVGAKFNVNRKTG